MELLERIGLGRWARGRRSSSSSFASHAYGQRARRRLLMDPPGLVIAGFAWGVMLAALAALTWSISHWLGTLSPMGLLLELWFAALFGMCMWCHLAVMTTDPGAVPAKLTGVTAGDDTHASRATDRVQAEEDAHVQSKDGCSRKDGAGEEETNDDDDEFEEYEVEIPLTELENHEDDGSLLLFCDECAIYRPARLVLSSRQAYVCRCSISRRVSADVISGCAMLCSLGLRMPEPSTAVHADDVSPSTTTTGAYGGSCSYETTQALDGLD